VVLNRGIIYDKVLQIGLAGPIEAPWREFRVVGDVHLNGTPILLMGFFYSFNH
jgi:hypothetical protein